MERWDKPNIPHKGWKYLDVEDVGENYEKCQICGKEGIRYVHILTHPEYGEIRVGCECASKMLDDYINPQEREKKFKNKANRYLNFSKIQWKHNQQKNTYSAKYKGEYITIKQSQYGNFGIVFQSEMFWRYNGKNVKDLETAKLFAFSIFDEKHKPIGERYDY